MAKPLRFVGLLLITSALIAPAAFAQAPADSQAGATAGAAAAPAAPESQDSAAPAADAPADPAAPPAEDNADVSIPGGAIVVTGRRNANVEKSSAAVVSVLSAAAIARTGEGNIAGALGRVTGLSVVGNGFVYVRGLGDRYSLALLNGLPLPSPEPLKRVVPLDLFPTNIVSSSLVQKSYSPNFPGEFGGGVINLTTNAVPKESSLTFTFGTGANSETTGLPGYVHRGAHTDWTGFDNGSRNTPPALAAFLASGKRISSGTVDSTAIAGELVNWNNAVVQRWSEVMPNFNASLSGGTSFEIGDDAQLGLIATAGYSNKWQTRDAIQQKSLTPDLSDLESNFERVSTDNRIVANALVGLGLEFGDNKARWTNLFIRDTLKHTRLGLGQRHGTTVDYMQQDTAWYERQLIDTQLVLELKPLAGVSLELRSSYANSQREAPAELSLEYVRTNVASDPFGAHFVNRLNNGNGGDATISYSDLNEDLWSGGVDLSYRFSSDFNVSLGYAYLRTIRDSSRRDFQFSAASMPNGVDMRRPDLLLAKDVVDAFDIALIETNEGNPAFRAKLFNHAAYGKANWQITPSLSIDGGVRYETAKEIVAPLQVFQTAGASTAATNLKNSYWLPAVTLTLQARTDMQVRLSASKTIARPQFRELIYQFYFDPDSNRQYQGNPYLTDSKLLNLEARYEWYFARDQRFSVAGFFKKIDKPIEAFITGGDFTTSFANAPKADLYGAELELQKYFDISNMSDAKFFAARRLVLISNYTYTKSKIKVGTGDGVAVYGASSTNATDFFRDGAPLTGQSDHLINLQLGLEDQDSLSQQTLILSYASKRVTSRGLANQNQPDVYEYPGFNLDFVMRQGIMLAKRKFDFKFEVRNLTNRKYRETQSNGTNSVIYNRYNSGTTINLSLSTTF